MGKKAGNLPKLIYFPAYGKAEPIRMMLNHANVPFEDIHINKDEFNARKERGEIQSQIPVW